MVPPKSYHTSDPLEVQKSYDFLVPFGRIINVKYYVIILGGGGSQSHDYLDNIGEGGLELGKTWLRNMCTLPNLNLSGAMLNSSLYHLAP